jgi:arsenate reductase
MADKIYNVLFICTSNSARSIMAEVVMNHLGRDRFKAYSAGSHPRDEVHPMTLEVLAGRRFDIGGLRSKSWTEFAAPDAPPMDFIFTVLTRPPARLARHGPASPSLRIGASQTRQRLKVITISSSKRFVLLKRKLPTASACFSVCP